MKGVTGLLLLFTAAARVTPDYVTVAMTVSEEGTDTAKIKRAVDDRTIRLLEVAARFRIAAADVKSSGIRIRSVYETDRNDNDLFKGYAVERALDIKLRKIADYEALAQELAAGSAPCSSRRGMSK